MTATKCAKDWKFGRFAWAWRVCVLLVLLALESLLALSLRHWGWQQTWIVAGWCAVAVAAVCCAIGVPLLVRRWARVQFRIRIRTLLLSFALLSAGLAVVSPLGITPFLERNAGRRLESLGAEVKGQPRIAGDTATDREIASVQLNTDQMIVEAANSLEALPNLKALYLFPGVTDRGVRALSQLNLPDDVSLDIFAANVTDDGFESLRNCRWPFALGLHGRTLSSRVVVAVSKLRQVKVLLLVNEGPGKRPRITDDALRAVGTMTQLEKLMIIGTDITGDGLRSLSGLTNLRTLLLKNTQASQQAVNDLQELLPECKIVARD